MSDTAVCEHGGLRRKCETCEERAARVDAEGERDHLMRVLDTIADAEHEVGAASRLEDLAVRLRQAEAERDALRESLAEVERQAEAELAEVRARIAELEAWGRQAMAFIAGRRSCGWFEAERDGWRLLGEP